MFRTPNKVQLMGTIGLYKYFIQDCTMDDTGEITDKIGNIVTLNLVINDYIWIPHCTPYFWVQNGHGWHGAKTSSFHLWHSGISSFFISIHIWKSLFLIKTQYDWLHQIWLGLVRNSFKQASVNSRQGLKLPGFWIFGAPKNGDRKPDPGAGFPPWNQGLLTCAFWQETQKLPRKSKFWGRFSKVLID